MYRMIRTLFTGVTLSLLVASSAMLAQVAASTAVNDGEGRAWKFGTEIDALPYIMNGYYASAFVGHEGWRIRTLAARSEVPSFLVTSGFEKKRTDAYALVLDRFLGAKKNQLRGFWICGGGEEWRNRIRQDGTSTFTYYNNFVLTGGTGYVWKLSKNFYLNPWAAVHAPVAGSRDINVSGREYTQPRLTPEFSVKFGIMF